MESDSDFFTAIIIRVSIAASVGNFHVSKNISRSTARNCSILFFFPSHTIVRRKREHMAFVLLLFLFNVAITSQARAHLVAYIRNLTVTNDVTTGDTTSATLDNKEKGCNTLSQFNRKTR